MATPVRYTVLIWLLLVASGCGHSLSPLYEDFRIRDASDTADLRPVMEKALTEAGWTLDDPDAPNIVSTSESTVAHWGLYKVVVSLDLAAINGSHVRVFVHPYRVYAWGSRSKMVYMSRRVRNHVFPELTQALAQQGIRSVEIDLADETSY